MPQIHKGQKLIGFPLARPVRETGGSGGFSCTNGLGNLRDDETNGLRMFFGFASGACIEVLPDVHRHAMIRQSVGAYLALPIVGTGRWTRLAIAAHDMPSLITVTRSHGKHSCPTRAVVLEEYRLGLRQTMGSMAWPFSTALSVRRARCLRAR